MRAILFVCLSQALLCSVVFGHHDKEEEHHGEESEDHAMTTALEKIIPSNIKFAYSLYPLLAEKYPNDNIFFSPISISVLFSMVSAGARGATQAQIYKGLCFNMSVLSEEDINKGFQQQLHALDQRDSDLELSSANALFVEQGTKLLEKFSEDLKNFYGAEAIATDFENGDEAKNQINSYVEKKTNGKIKDLLSSINPAALLVLVNTIYFKGTWMHAFDKARTKEADFYVDENTVVKVPMMTIKEKFLVAFVREIGCAVVDIPYKGNTSAILIAPEKGKIHEVEKAVQNVSLQTWAKRMRPMEILLSIPRFSVSASLNLKDELSALGITDVFSDKADLSGITGDRLVVSEAVHKAVLSMDEKGAEAAGASAAVITKLSLPRQVVVNSPFLITLLHKPTETILFTGRVMKP